jgi:hypothetical protein
MEDGQLTFTQDRITYRIDPHIWRDYPNRIELVSVERIQDTVLSPDFEEDETDSTKILWKWFPELGRLGNYIKVIVEVQENHREITTSYSDSVMRSRRKAP